MNTFETPTRLVLHPLSCYYNQLHVASISCVYTIHATAFMMIIVSHVLLHNFLIYIDRPQTDEPMKHHGADASVELHAYAYCTLDMRL